MSPKRCLRHTRRYTRILPKVQFKDIEANFVCQLIFTAAAVYVLALVVAKLSLVSLYHRIMENQEAYNSVIHITSVAYVDIALPLYLH